MVWYFSVQRTLMLRDKSGDCKEPAGLRNGIVELDIVAVMELIQG